MKLTGSHPRTLAIYDSPRDFPGHFVVRSWFFAPDGKLTPDEGALTYDTATLGRRGALSAARAYCNRLGLSFIPRNWNDDPVIVETWNGKPKWRENADRNGVVAQARSPVAMPADGMLDAFSKA